MNPEERNRLLIGFCHEPATDQNRKDVDKILVSAGTSQEVVNKEDYTLFLARDFHPEVIKHCWELFLQSNYFHAVFEGCKAYNSCVKQKAQSLKDGDLLMLDVWGCEKGVLKVTPCSRQKDKDVQDGIKFL